MKILWIKNNRKIWREINFRIFFRLQVPISQDEIHEHVQGASPDIAEQTDGKIRKIVDEQITASLKKVLPSLLKEALADQGTTSQLGGEESETPPEEPNNASPSASRLDRYYSTTKESAVSDEILAVIKTAFSKQLTKDVWSNLMEKYPQIKGTDDILVAPIMETGTKEYMRQKFGYQKTKELFAFDDGLAERQAPFLSVARPIAAALERLDAPDILDDEASESGPDPDEIKSLLEDALVLLGNANVRLNQWRQKRFSEYLTDVGKRTLKAGIPTDKHLFPDQFHKVVQSEHEHSSTNSKLIATPAKPSMGHNNGPKKPFSNAPQNRSDRRLWGKRKWSSRAETVSQGTSRYSSSSPNPNTKRFRGSSGTSKNS